MSNAALEEIIEEGSKALPPDEREQLQGLLLSEELRQQAIVYYLLALGLVDLLEKRDALAPDKRQRFHDLLNHAAVDAGLITKADLVKKIRGKYARLGLSSEAFAAQKQEEIRLENRR